MFPNALQRPALGQKASLGTLYNAHDDSFKSLSLFKTSPPASAIATRGVHSIDIKVTYNETHQEKFDHLGADTNLAASFEGGLIDVAGSARYLDEYVDAQLARPRALYHTITTVHEQLNFSASDMKHCLASSQLDGGTVTHFVAQISWGLKTIVTAQSPISNERDSSELDGRLKSEFKLLQSGSPGDDSGLNKTVEEADPGVLLRLRAYYDALPVDATSSARPCYKTNLNFEDVRNSIRKMPSVAAGINGGKGLPLMYTLFPLTLLAYFSPIQIRNYITVRQPSGESLDKVARLLHEVWVSQEAMDDYEFGLVHRQGCLINPYVRKLSQLLEKVEQAYAELQSKFGSLLKDIRRGKKDVSELENLLMEVNASEFAPQKIMTKLQQHKESIEFMDLIMAKGIIYIGDSTPTLDAELMKNQCDEAYILYFSQEVRGKNPTWKENLDAFLDLAMFGDNRCLLFAVDCDEFDDVIDNPYISHYRSGQIIMEDVVEHQKLLADKCIYQYDKRHLDESVKTKPLKRTRVRIPCPGNDCNPNIRCDWVCPWCFSTVEYGYLDNFLYCDCGRVMFKYCQFKCKEAHHGPHFHQYQDESKLLQLLKGLEPNDELNILILGETGVGKSTFINAFVNYLTFSSMDDAMALDTVNSIIPCSFATQCIDKADENGKIVQKEIKIGTTNDDEHSGVTGRSATQKTQVYPVNIGDYRVRLIDTPGIGDTRGAEQDQKNMADILSVLKNYDKLHGILILLKPNNSRLTVTFKFCIKELLTHLHRDAALNMVFGFTNTRGSNYQPGDTFKPLETLLSNYKEVEFGLYRHTVYCFDSESFRYLAAHYQGVDMGHMDDYRRSWKHSSAEAQRLLAHFRSLIPHRVKSTLSLNQTRQLIAQLTKPMAEIAQKIKASIAVNADSIEDLSNKRMSYAELHGKLHVEKITLQAEKIDQPRTVCVNVSCVEFHDDGVGPKGKDLKTVYKTLCHNPCWLDNVEVEKIGFPSLRNCAAFSTDGTCRICGHLWQEHMHILYELRPKTVKIKDTAVEQALQANADSIKLKETAIRAKRKAIEEFQAEHDKIQTAAVQFSLFLKTHSITPYNDATIEYLDFLIKEEQEKIAVGGSPERLDSLRQYRREYQELVMVLTESMKSDEDCTLLNEHDVDRTVKQLYSLKHFGDSLRSIQTVVETAHATTYREKEYNMRVSGRWTNGWTRATLRPIQNYVRRIRLPRISEPFGYRWYSR